MFKSVFKHNRGVLKEKNFFDPKGGVLRGLKLARLSKEFNENLKKIKGIY